MSEKVWIKIARYYIKSGKLPIRVSNVITDILKTLVTLEQAEFIAQLRKHSYNLEELKSVTGMDDVSLNTMLNDLMNIGVLTGIRSRRTGVTVYRKPPLFPGILEFTLMRGEKNEQTKKLAKLIGDFYEQIIHDTKVNYDQMMVEFNKSPAPTRVIPIEEEIDTKEEVVLAYENLENILEQYDTIGLSTCYCRHRKDLVGDPCVKTDERKNCLSLGGTAEFLIEHGFSEKISREEALVILKKAEDGGLVHKAFHVNLEPERELDGICNCCKCCCGTFEIHYGGGAPLMDITSHVAKVDEDLCVGCETCVQECNAEAIDMIDNIAVIDEDRCIGCGVCAHLCPERAMKLERIPTRKAFSPPRGVKTEVKS